MYLCTKNVYIYNWAGLPVMTLEWVVMYSTSYYLINFKYLSGVHEVECAFVRGHWSYKHSGKPVQCAVCSVQCAVSSAV